LPELTIDCPSDTTSRQIAEYIQRAIAQIGVKLQIRSSTWAEFLGRIRTKKSQVFAMSWLYDYPDGENGFQLLYGKNESPGPNEANYKNKKYDELFEKYAPLQDGREREKLAKRMRDIVSEEVPWLFFVHRMETRLTHPWVEGFKIHLFEHNIE